LRTFLQSLQDKSCPPLFIIFKNSDLAEEDIQIISNSQTLKMKDFHYTVINSNIVAEFKNFKIIIIRPDHIIEYVEKNQ
jgi:hypothetical protein